jgi:hypothetical protein
MKIQQKRQEVVFVECYHWCQIYHSFPYLSTTRHRLILEGPHEAILRLLTLVNMILQGGSRPPPFLFYQALKGRLCPLIIFTDFY